MRALDLSHVLTADITVWPGTESPTFREIHIDGCTETQLTMHTHNGTHLDAPYHLRKDARPLGAFPVDKFLGKGLTIDCRSLAGALITVDFLRAFEDQIKNTEFVLLHSGWSSKWKTRDYFYDFPVPSADAAEWLTHFGLKGIGVDSISLDKFEHAHLPNHHIVLEKEILIIENLTNLERLPPSSYVFQCLPLKLENADGSPVRAVATFEN